jgi:hypothetical protein
MLAKDTRPISVTNADNRLIAKALTNAITPALQKLIDPDQKGFVPGRVGTDHVHSLLNSFHTHVRAKKRQFILLLDTARAFDTISHDFIHACLAHVGMPLWVQETVRGLLHQVFVNPLITNNPEHLIAILRGVKQGCPSSPLLFVLCFDILLHYLSLLPQNKRHAFADDLAITTPRVTTLIAALTTIDEFSRHSGLGLNMGKTHILPATTPPRSMRRRLDEAGYSAVSFSDSEKYLGVRVGRTVTTFDVFQDAFDKFIARLNSYRPVLRTCSIHDRIIIFYYLAQFYIIPYPTITVPVRNLTRTAIIPFNGGGFSYVHLITPSRGQYGFHTPLRDLWSTNYTLLASPFDLEASDGSPTPELGNFADVPPHSYNFQNSMRIDEFCTQPTLRLSCSNAMRPGQA